MLEDRRHMNSRRIVSASPRSSPACRAGASRDVGRRPSCSAFVSRCARAAPPDERRPSRRTPSSGSTGQGDVTLIMPQVEMGQGTYTSISMILAEELDADWSRVRVEHAPADEKLYANPDLSIQATGNSNSIRAFWKPLRLAGAATRACFIEAAARSWGVSGRGMPDGEWQGHPRSHRSHSSTTARWSAAPPLSRRRRIRHSKTPAPSA